MNIQNKIVDWIKDYAEKNKRKTLVVGISGGIDSSVVSTLCAMTKLPTIAVSMPINQIESQHDLSMDHGEWLEDKFDNVVEKGKDFFEDLKNKDIKAVEEAKKEIENELKPKTEEKSARERLKDKGLM